MNKPLALLTVLCLSAVAAAQDAPLHTRVTVSYHERDFAEVLKDLGDRAGVRFVCPDELARGQGKVTLATTQQEIGRIARRILRPRGLLPGRVEAGQVLIGRLDALDEIRAKRADRFEFAEKPTAARDGDQMTIRFAVTDFCDATVAIEDHNGRILRHLASGVLGENAPEPFRWNTRRQEIVWDCKDDRGEYVRSKDLTVRVSLGLAARFERTLYWSPYKLGQNCEQPTFGVAPEGVYVFGAGVGRASLTPALRLFDHDGRYVRSLFPFPTSQIDQAQGVTLKSYPPDGPDRKFALKGPPEAQTSVWPWPAATGELLKTNDVRPMLVTDKDYVYLLGVRSIRIAKSNSARPSSLEGPEAIVTVTSANRTFRYYPNAAALSPDGKWIYLTGYSAFYGKDEGHGWLHYMPCVMRMPSDCSKGIEPFIGVATPDATNANLANPSGVAVDREGRLYVADITEGLLIFTPEGKLLHQMKMDSAAAVHVSPNTGEIFVTGWTLNGAYGGPRTGQTPESKANVMLYRLTAWKADSPPKIVKTFVVAPENRANAVHPCSVAMAFTGKTPRMWFSNALGGWGLGGSGPNWQTMNTRIFDVGDDKLTDVLSFETQAKREVVQSRPPRYARQRPYLNPADGCVYVAEQIQPTIVSDVQSFDQLVKIDPNTGRCSMIDLPFDAEDAAFDMNGMIYLRTDSSFARYDPVSWREVPFDYGLEMDKMTHYDLKTAQTISSPYFKGGRGASGKIFGMGVNAQGDVAISFYSTDVSSADPASENPDTKRPVSNVVVKGARPWLPRVYPGRSTYAFIHIWNKHGQLKFEDAVRGLGEMSDFKIDNDGNLYMVSNLVLPQYFKAHPDKFINTLVKMPAGAGRILTDSKTVPIPLEGAAKPGRPPDAIGLSGYRGNVWLDGMEWALGGLGANARDLSARACHCEANCGIALDYYSRSFVPAIHRYEVAVADSAGNIMLRIGRYGNVEDGAPLVKDGGPAETRSLGGDELALVSPKWLAVHSDRRLFVSDRGNYRLASVKLSYRTEERVVPTQPAEKP